MSITLVVLLAAVVAAALIVLAIRWAARDYLRPRGRRSERTPESLGLAGERFELATRAGTIRGWLVRAAPGPRPTVLVAHGWQSHAGDMLVWAEPIVRAGHHAIVYDALGHGDSDPQEFTSLRHMHADLDAVTAWARSLPEAAPGLVVFGHSMGGAAAILAASEEPSAMRPSAGAPLRGVIVAGAPTDPIEVTREFLDAKGLPGGLMIRAMLPFWKRIVAAPPEAIRPIRRIAAVEVPVLVLHGAEDRQVSRRHAEELAAACPDARLVLIDRAQHNDLPQHPTYAAAVLTFLAERFPAAAAS